MKEILLTKGCMTIVEDDDYDYLVSLGKWLTTTHGYAAKRVKQRMVAMHRIVLSRHLGRELDRSEYVDAVKAYNDAAIKYHKAFAVPNDL